MIVLSRPIKFLILKMKFLMSTNVCIFCMISFLECFICYVDYDNDKYEIHKHGQTPHLIHFNCLHAVVEYVSFFLDIFCARCHCRALIECPNLKGMIKKIRFLKILCICSSIKFVTMLLFGGIFHIK